MVNIIVVLRTEIFSTRPRYNGQWLNESKTRVVTDGRDVTLWPSRVLGVDVRWRGKSGNSPCLSPTTDRARLWVTLCVAYLKINSSSSSPSSDKIGVSLKTDGSQSERVWTSLSWPDETFIFLVYKWHIYYIYMYMKKNVRLFVYLSFIQIYSFIPISMKFNRFDLWNERKITR